MTGDKFESHFDGVFVRRGKFWKEKEGEFSQLTFLMYLNEDYEGCETVLYPEYSEHKRRFTNVPHTGLVLIHSHKILHEAAPLIRGRKYVIRTDIIFKRK